MQILNQIINQFPGFILGVVSTAITIFVGGFSKLIFGEIKRIRKHKLNVAIEVHKLCNEASLGNYKKKKDQLNM